MREYPYHPIHTSRPVAVAVTAQRRDLTPIYGIGVIVLLALLFGAFSAYGAKPMKVTASDLIEKVYGVADPESGREACQQVADESFSGSPKEEDGAEWISGEEGFVISYHGQSPEAEAMVRYDADAVDGYGYIFYFPYAASQRDKANKEQCKFCSALFDELCELGAVMGADPTTQELFDVDGELNGKDVQLTLSEDRESPTDPKELQAGAIDPACSGQFVLVMSVVPANAVPLTAEVAE